MALLFFEKNNSVHAGRRMPATMFFVRVNQVLVRLWARVISRWVRCGVVGLSDNGSLITDH